MSFICHRVVDVVDLKTRRNTSNTRRVRNLTTRLFQQLRVATSILPVSLLQPLLENSDPPASLLRSFLGARAELSRTHPDFGKSDIGARQWWSLAVLQTFRGCGVDLTHDEKREELVSALYDGFARDPSNYHVFVLLWSLVSLANCSAFSPRSTQTPDPR
jgi:hypothetical protein